MESEQKPSLKRSLDDNSVSRSSKRQKIAKDSCSIDTNDKTGNDLKLLNGYMIWLHQFYNGRAVTPETISKKVLGPLSKLINRIDFRATTNVWCDSQLLFELIKRKYWASGIIICEACSDFPPKIGDIVYKSSSLELYSTSMRKRTEISLEKASDSLLAESDVPVHVVKVVHAEFCRVEKRLGYNQQELEACSCLLGLEHKHTQLNGDGPVHGWIINPQWNNLCSKSYTKD